MFQIPRKTVNNRQTSVHNNGRNFPSLSSSSVFWFPKRQMNNHGHCAPDSPISSKKNNYILSSLICGHQKDLLYILISKSGFIQYVFSWRWNIKSYTCICRFECFSLRIAEDPFHRTKWACLPQTSIAVSMSAGEHLFIGWQIFFTFKSMNALIMKAVCSKPLR